MQFKVKRLNHVQISIPTGQEERARAFYGKTLGLEEIEKPGALKPYGGLWYKIADIQLHIGVDETQLDSKRHSAFEVEGLERIKDYLCEHGVRINEEPAIPGVNRFSFFDPFGNRLEFLEMKDA